MLRDIDVNCRRDHLKQTLDPGYDFLGVARCHSGIFVEDDVVQYDDYILSETESIIFRAHLASVGC